MLQIQDNNIVLYTFNTISYIVVVVLVSRCDPHGRFTIVYRSDDTGGAALAARRVIQRMTK